MTPSQAEIMAGQVVVWLARDDERMAAFLGDSGLQVADLRDAVEDPAFLAAIMDWLLQSDEQVTAFCTDHALDYTQPARARQLLPGGDLPNWT